MNDAIALIGSAISYLRMAIDAMADAHMPPDAIAYASKAVDKLAEAQKALVRESGMVRI